MQIRKLYKFESAHIVRNCSSDRCKRSLHGHGYKVEVLLTSDKIDFGGMVLDFGLTKGNIHDFIDSFDHCYQMWDKESDQFKNDIKKYSARWIEMPVTPSAEMYSVMMFYVIDKIIRGTEFANGEGNVRLHSVRVHETDTGYAESFREDLQFWDYKLEDIVFSEQVQNEWKNKTWFNDLLEYFKSDCTLAKPFVNEPVTQQI